MPKEEEQQSFVRVLLRDALAAMKRNIASDDQLSRRDLVRTLFAACEGLIWVFREHIHSSAATAGELRAEEAGALSEVVFSTNEQGRVSSQRRYISISATIRLCVRIACRLDPALAIRFDDPAWQEFRTFVEMRNRLSHPKALADLHISDTEAVQCVSSFFWLFEIVAQTMESANRAVVSHLAELKKLFEELQAGDPQAWAEYRGLLDSIEE